MLTQLLPFASLPYHSCRISFFFYCSRHHRHLPSFPTRRSSDLTRVRCVSASISSSGALRTTSGSLLSSVRCRFSRAARSEEHTSELQSLTNLVCRLLLEKKKQRTLRSLRFYKRDI